MTVSDPAPVTATVTVPVPGIIMRSAHPGPGRGERDLGPGPRHARARRRRRSVTQAAGRGPSRGSGPPPPGGRHAGCYRAVSFSFQRRRRLPRTPRIDPDVTPLSAAVMTETVWSHDDSDIGGSHWTDTESEQVSSICTGSGWFMNL